MKTFTEALEVVAPGATASSPWQRVQAADKVLDICSRYRELSDEVLADESFQRIVTSLCCDAMNHRIDLGSLVATSFMIGLQVGTEMEKGATERWVIPTPRRWWQVWR